MTWCLLNPEGGDISGICWKMLAGLAGAIVAMAIYIVRIHKAYGKKLNEVYDGRITDLKANNDLVDTLMKVIYRSEKKKGG